MLVHVEPPSVIRRNWPDARLNTMMRVQTGSSTEPEIAKSLV